MTKIAQKPREQNCKYCVQIFVFTTYIDENYKSPWIECIQHILNMYRLLFAFICLVQSKFCQYKI